MLFAPVSHSLQAPLQAFSHRLDVDRERSSAVSRCDVCETEKVERLRRLSARSLRFPHRRPAKLDEPGLLGMEREPVFGESLSQHFQHSLRVLLVLKAQNESSSAGESHPHALTEPDMKLAPHPAPTIQPQVLRLCFKHRLLPLLVGLYLRPDRQAPSLHPRYRASSLLRACPPLRLASVLYPLRVCRLGISLEHRGWRFPRSAQEPALNSRRLYAGHHSGSKQVAPELCPGATTGLRF